MGLFHIKFVLILCKTLIRQPLVKKSISGWQIWMSTSNAGNNCILTRQNKMNCELMLTYDTPALRQTGSRNLTGQKTLLTIWGTYMKLVTKYQISAISSYWEKCEEKYLGRTDRWTEVKQYTPLPLRGAGV